MAEHGFERTTCACPRCVACCKTQAGPLAPGDYERILEHTGLHPEEARLMFWASPGSYVRDRRTGQERWVGTITPQMVRGRCVFLQPDDRCGIHAVSPFGCAFFDMHQKPAVYQPRSVWLVQAIDASPDYQRLRATLPVRPAVVRTCGSGDIAW